MRLEGFCFMDLIFRWKREATNFSMDVEGQNLENAMVEISSNAGENVFASAEISQAGKVSVTFTLETAESGIETRMWVGESSGIVCRNLEIRQLSGQETIRN